MNNSSKMNNWFSDELSFFGVEPKKSALLIVDMQYMCAHPDYGAGVLLKSKNPDIAEYYFDRLEKFVIPNIKKLLIFFRSKKLDVFYLTFTPQHSSCRDLFSSGKINDLRQKMSENERLFYPKGHFNSNIIKEIELIEGELVINKLSAGAFATSNIDAVLRNMDIETLFFTGVGTNMCVESTLRGAVDRNYNCIIVDDACATYDQESHDASIKIVREVFGKSRNTNKVIEEYPWKIYELKLK